MAKPNLSFELAHWFVEEFLGRAWDKRFDNKHLGNAKSLVNPVGEEPLDMDVIKFCLTKMREGEWGWKKPVTSLYAVTWTDFSGKSYYQLAVDLIATPPPIYEITRYDNWIVLCGRTARRLGVWDGLYRGYDNPLERQFRLDPLKLAEVVGD